MDPKDPAAENFYPEPVTLDATHSRQYIQINANGRRIVAMPDTGATVNFMSKDMYDQFFSHLPLRQMGIHQVVGVTDKDRERGAKTLGLVQLRVHFCGKVINTNFLVGETHDPRIVILGQAWQDRMVLHVGYDRRNNRVVYMNQRIVPSCIICNGRLAVVRTMHMANKTVETPYLQPRQCQNYRFPMTEYPNGTELVVAAGITDSGLAVVSHLTTVRNRTITVPVFNLTAQRQQVFPELYKLDVEPLEEFEDVVPLDLDGQMLLDGKVPGETTVKVASTEGTTTASDPPIGPEDLKPLPEGVTIDRPYDAARGMRRIRAMIQEKRKRGAKVPEYTDVDWSKSDLTEEEVLIAKYGMEEVVELFATHKDDFKDIVGIEHHIDVQGADPIAQPMRPVPLAKRGVITEEVNRMLRCGVIRPSTSPWSSPIVLIRKKDGGWRFCVDYRRLNDLTKKDKHPLPRIDDMLDRLSEGRFFSSVDLNSGYWQISMAKDSYEPTAFTVTEGHYEFVKMPFGLTNAPATFQRGMQMILAYVNYKICLCFLDDVIIFSKEFWQHLYDLLCVLLALLRAGVRLSGKKCEFFKKSIDFLGHVVSAQGIATQARKTEKIRDMLTPKNEKELRSILGLTGYYRKFCKNYATIAAPLYAMLRRKPPGETFESQWGEKEDRALQLLKERLTEPPILAFADISKDFRLATDASMDGMGNILSQLDDEGAERVIAYGGRTWHESEKNYHMPNKECLSVVYAFSQYRQYLLGAKTLLITDCSCLVPLLTSKALRSVVPEGQIFRWMLALQEYDYEIVHLVGSKVPHADAMSRMPIAHGDPPNEKDGENDLDSKLVFILHTIQYIIDQKALQKPSQPRRSPRFADPAVPPPGPVAPPAAATANDSSEEAEEVDEDSGDDEEEGSGDLSDLARQNRQDQATEGQESQRIVVPVKGGKFWKGTATTYQKPFLELLNFSTPWLAADIERAQAIDAAFGPLAEYKRSGVMNNQWSTLIKNWIPAHHEEFFLYQNLLYHVNLRKQSGTGAVYHIQMCIPHPFRLTLLEQFHTTVWGAHQSMDAMLAKLEIKYYWPSMVADTRSFVETCAPCQVYKVGPNKRVPLKPIRAVSPFYMLGVDILTPCPAAVTRSGNKHILVVQDYFTKWVVAIPIPDQTASTVLRSLLDHVFSIHGCPRIVLSDNGPCFTANQFTASMKEMGIDQRYAAPYHQQTNGMVERWNRTLLVMLRPLMQENADNWDEYLQMACFAYRTTPHSSTGRTPFEMLFGRDPVFPRDALFSNTQKVYSDNDYTYMRRLVEKMKSIWAEASKNLDEAQERYRRQYDKRARVRHFEEGSYVLRVLPGSMSAKHVPSKFHAYFDHLFRVKKDLGTDLLLEKVLPPRTNDVKVPKQFCKLFRGTVRDYADMQEGITVPPSDWTHLTLFPKKTRAQQTDPKAPVVGDEEDDDNAICPVCKTDYESTKTRPWIQCDRCYHWFHFACVGLEKEPRENRWYCDPCAKARRIPGERN